MVWWFELCKKITFLNLSLLYMRFTLQAWQHNTIITLITSVLFLVKSLKKFKPSCSIMKTISAMYMHTITLYEIYARIGQSFSSKDDEHNFNDWSCEKEKLPTTYTYALLSVVPMTSSRYNAHQLVKSCNHYLSICSWIIFNAKSLLWEYPQDFCSTASLFSSTK